jgi:hypothetical protein
MSHILFKHMRLEHSTMASPVSKAYHLTCIVCHRHILSCCRIVLTIIWSKYLTYYLVCHTHVYCVYIQRYAKSYSWIGLLLATYALVESVGWYHYINIVYAKSDLKHTQSYDIRLAALKPFASLLLLLQSETRATKSFV